MLNYVKECSLFWENKYYFLVIISNMEIKKIDGKSFIHHGGTESTERRLFFDLSAKLSGQIKILSPAMRHRITLTFVMDTTNLCVKVIVAAINVHNIYIDTAPTAVAFSRSRPALWYAKPIRLGSRDRAKKENTLCELCASVVKYVVIGRCLSSGRKMVKIVSCHISF